MRLSKKIFLASMIILFLVTYISAQPPDTLWTKTYGGYNQDYAFSIQPTLDGGYIITGLTSSFGAGGDDVYLVKTDANGNTVWTKTFGGPYEDWGRSVKQTLDGGYIIAGWTTSFGAGDRDVYLIKTDGNGNTIWTKTFGGTGQERGYFVQQTPEGGYIVVGTTWSFGAGDGDVYLIKTDDHGNTLWTRTYGGNGYDFCRSIQVTPDSGFIMAGQTSSYGHGGDDAYLIRANKNGEIIWSRTFGAINDDAIYSVGLTSDGGYITTGGTKSFGAGNWDVYLIKTNSAGDLIWSKTFGGYSEERCHEVQETSDGGYISFGFTSSFGAGHYDFYLIRTDANGDSLWTKTWGGNGWDMGESGSITSDSSYIVTGYTESFGAGGGDFWVIKTKSTTMMFDVGVTQILSPTGSIYHGSHVLPKVIVQNFGNSETTFPVVFKITPTITGYLNERVHQVTEENYYSDTVEITLASNATDTVEFTSWEAVLGEYNTISYTVLTGDENSSNDTAYGSFNVVTRLRHDVGPLQILNPLDTIYAGTIVTPVAVIKNFGLHEESFLVFFMIIGEYIDFRFMSLEAGQIDTIIFDPWFALAGNYNEMVATYLQTDENPENNIVLEILRVIGEQRNDVGGNSIKMSYNLFKPYPNPTSDNLFIRFSLMQPCHVDMKIFDINGRIVKNLVSETKAPGVYSLNTNCTSFRNGVYIIKLKTEDFETIEKFLVTR